MTKITGPSIHSKRVLARKLWKTKKNIWRDVSKHLMKPSKNKVEINLRRLNKVTSEGESIVIPGKLLGEGELNHKIKVAYYSASKSAKLHLEEKGCDVISIEEMYEQNPTGSNIKIII